ncbi:3-oxoacyl-acyl-carrier-protein synthase II, chloroplastic-like protein isoform X1 [Cinnamomum micranthum f. kanehirae]|uniref:beta-ketoacyl-[acyl-carrier-protein] synthase I n=1 Tax=Cinnamomum micranthum f. kanehirae TaxID=337451 RepID=A0A3S4NER4_9MAGN|nr:3-oxoacyl-acyl-carrier-protein synthase II, chloroplastic-like protein isoform X1 [Cinnamomum micranthum f. kanehirae]
MVVSSVASPLCTWLVAACMSVACEKDSSMRISGFAPSKRWSKWVRRQRVVLKGGREDFPKGLISAFCGASIQGLMSSCLAFEPCEEYYSSKGLSLSPSSLSSFFGESGFSLFGGKEGTTRRQRRMVNRAASGKTMNVAVEPSKEVVKKEKPVTKQRRVVVTGMGVVTPLGHDPDVFYNNLLEGVSGISEIEAFDCSHFPTRIAGEIKNFSSDGCMEGSLMMS